MLNRDLLVPGFECRFFHKKLNIHNEAIRVDDVDITYLEGGETIDSTIYKLELTDVEVPSKKFIVVTSKKYGLEWFCEY